MKIEEFYEATGGSYQDAIGRLDERSFVITLDQMFPQDPSFAELKKSMESRDRDGAYHGAHTLKGIAGNLGFVKLYEDSADLAKELRTNGFSEKALALYQETAELYEKICQDLTLVSEE